MFGCVLCSWSNTNININKLVQFSNCLPTDCVDYMFTILHIIKFGFEKKNITTTTLMCHLRITTAIPWDMRGGKPSKTLRVHRWATRNSGWLWTCCRFKSFNLHISRPHFRPAPHPGKNIARNRKADYRKRTSKFWHMIGVELAANGGWR